MKIVTAVTTQPINPVRESKRDALRTRFNKNVLTFLAVGIFLFLYVPILVLIVFSFNENRFVSTWTGFSLDWYRVLFQDSQMGSAFSSKHLGGRLVYNYQHHSGNISSISDGALSFSRQARF